MPVSKPQFSPEGPRDAKIMIVGEALGQQEELLGGPFKGKSGQELTAMLREAGIDRKECYLTNVFWRRPPENKLEAWCHSKKDAKAEGLDHLPAIKSGKYIKREFLEDVTPADWLEIGPYHHDYERNGAASVLTRLSLEIREVQPNIIIALGNTPTWALLGQTSITKIRGTVADCQLVPGVKVMPSLHPAFILRVWAQRPIALADLIKAKEEASTDLSLIPRRTVYVEPTREDLVEWERILTQAKMLSYDIETKAGQITCIGFAPNERESYVIPFTCSDRAKSFSYWAREEDEIEAWSVVKRLCALPNAKLAQNGAYDMQYLLRNMGIPVRGRLEDTMVLHHALHPELQKDLGFLGSIYTQEQSWKLLRRRGEDSNKRDD